MPAIPAELYRFPDRGGGIFYGCIYRSVVQTDSTVVSKTSDFGSYPDRPAIASWVTATHQALNLKLRVQIPRRLFWVISITAEHRALNP